MLSTKAISYKCLVFHCHKKVIDFLRKTTAQASEKEKLNKNRDLSRTVICFKISFNARLKNSFVSDSVPVPSFMARFMHVK